MENNNTQEQSKPLVGFGDNVKQSRIACPWCCGERTTIEKEFDGGMCEGDGDYYYWVECIYCGSHGPVAGTEDDAEDSWNRRDQTNGSQSPAEKSSNTQNNLSLGEKEKEKDGE